MVSFTTFKDLRNLGLAASALALAGGVALLGLFILQETTPCLKEAYDDEALTTLLVISSGLTTLAALVVLIAMLVNIRFVSNARKACVGLENSNGAKVMDNSLKHQMMTDKGDYDSNTNNAKMSLWAQIVSNVAAWSLNIVLVVFMSMSWAAKCKDDKCEDDIGPDNPFSAVEVSILSTLYGASVFVFQTTVAVVVVIHLFSIEKMCNKQKFPDFSARKETPLGGAKFQSWSGRMRQRVNTFSEF